MTTPAACARLRAWRESQALSVRKVAALLCTNPTSLLEWERDESRPRAFHQLLVHALTGIPVEAWLTTDEARELRRLREERVHGATIVPPPSGAVSP